MEAHLNIDQLDNAYQQDEKSFYSHVDGLEIGVGVYNANANPIACNPAAHQLLGLSKEQFMGNSAMDPYWKVSHEDGSKFETREFPIIHAITNYTPLLGVIMGVTRPLQDKIWLEVNTHPILNSDRTIKHVFCTYKDVSNRFDP
ncbi:MAG: PAS domain-containing protein [Cyclobacteriaceae bacterium]